MPSSKPEQTKKPAPGDPETGHQDPEQDEGPDQDQDEPEAPATQAAARMGRRGFLGAVGAMAAGAAAAAVLPEPEPVAAAATAAAGGLSSEAREMMTMFGAMMAERDARQMAQIDAKLSSIRAELAMAPPRNGTLASAYQPMEQPYEEEEPTAELAAPPGQHPSQLEAAVRGVPPRQRMVAFIPKEDPYNPRQTTFKTWTNGREIRSKRGQVMILTLGHGIDLAKNGHGNCVDIAAMQGIGSVAPLPIPQVPDFSRPANWDGMPLTNRSSFPVGATA